MCSQDAVQLRHRWEYDPEQGFDWAPIYDPPQRTIETSRFRSARLQSQTDEAQRVIVASGAGGVANRPQTLNAIVERLREGEGNRQTMLALTSAAASLVENNRECTRVWEAIGQDPVARRVIEPMLVKWKSNAAIGLWRDRIAGGTPDFGDLLVAIDGIAAVGDPSDRRSLERMLRSDDFLPAMKIPIARALGGLLDSGLEEFAQEILAADLDQRKLLAAYLLRRHSTSAALELLEELLASENEAAHAVAYAAIARIMPEKARQLAKPLIRHADNKVRLEVISVLNQLDDEDSLKLQAVALSDRNVNIRRTVRENLQHKAELPNLKQVVYDLMTNHLTGGSDDEAVEQAILLAVAFGENERAASLVALLDHPRPEVNIRAAWALQSLELDANILKHILAHCQITTEQLVNNVDVPFTDISRVAFLFEAIGRHAYQPAAEMLRLYVPREPLIMRPLTRASAIYALGHICAGQKNKELMDALKSRIRDDGPPSPEIAIVKYVSIVALARISDSPIVQKVE